jgi:hypothetical protein
LHRCTHPSQPALHCNACIAVQCMHCTSLHVIAIIAPHCTSLQSLQSLHVIAIIARHCTHCTALHGNDTTMQQRGSRA